LLDADEFLSIFFTAAAGISLSFLLSWLALSVNESANITSSPPFDADTSDGQDDCASCAVLRTLLDMAAWIFSLIAKYQPLSR
jgi:hypothetical protein